MGCAAHRVGAVTCRTIVLVVRDGVRATVEERPFRAAFGDMERGLQAQWSRLSGAKALVISRLDAGLKAGSSTKTIRCEG